jgi:hypothetical protein
MTMVEPAFMTPMVPTSHTMPSINPNYHINQHPGINNNSMFIQTLVFDQESNISAPSLFKTATHFRHLCHTKHHPTANTMYCLYRQQAHISHLLKSYIQLSFILTCRSRFQVISVVMHQMFMVSTP